YPEVWPVCDPHVPVAGDRHLAAPVGELPARRGATRRLRETPGPAQRGDEAPLKVEVVDGVAGDVHDVDGVRPRVDGEPPEVALELRGRRSGVPELEEVPAGGVEHLDPLVVRVGDVQTLGTGAGDGDPARRVQLPVARSLAPEAEAECARMADAEGRVCRPVSLLAR